MKAWPSVGVDREGAKRRPMAAIAACKAETGQTAFRTPQSYGSVSSSAWERTFQPSAISGEPKLGASPGPDIRPNADGRRSAELGSIP
jgi:hypothetical protein